MGFKIGICGIGSFSEYFTPLFLNHPLVEEVILCDLVPERARSCAEKYGIKRTVENLDELCKTDADAIALFTQRHLHGPQAVEILKAGKDVFCAVPAGISMEELETLVQTVEETGQIYMTSETSAYYPSTLFCRDKFQNEELGQFVYGEAQYMHDMNHFYDSFKRSGGENWKRLAGIPPMFYSTHSTSMILSITGATATSVSCLGIEDQHEDEIFKVGNNNWNNTFSNQSALMRTSDGGTMRINELRRIGYPQYQNSVTMNVFGTDGIFQENPSASSWVSGKTTEVSDVTDYLSIKNNHTVEDLKTFPDDDPRKNEFLSIADVHPKEWLPKSFRGLGNGHFGSHQFLTHKFIQALEQRQLDLCHVWDAANWCAPGLIAHESALNEGKVMQIPQFNAPKIT